MSENLSFFEEQSSNTPQTEYIDILSRPSWREFCDEVKEAESSVAIYDPSDENDLKKVNQRALDLSEKFGYEHNGKRSHVVGLGYNAYYREGADSSPSIVSTDSATFHGVDLCFVDGRWQAMLEFYCRESSEEMPHGIYHIPPDAHHLMMLNIDSVDTNENDEGEDVVKHLHEDYDSVTTFVRSEDFAHAPPDGQRMFLGDITQAADSGIPDEYRDREVVIECMRYYTAYDEMHFASYGDPTPGFDLRDFLTDQTNTPSEERRALKGVIVGIEYPELSLLPPDHKLDGNALNLNNGSYCLVLRSEGELENATHYILPQTIAEIY